MVIRLVLVGETGTGKSSTGNSILAQNVFPVSTRGTPTTRTCAAGETTRFGTKFVIVDTPSYFDGDDIDAEIKKSIKRCVELTHPGPQVFLFLFSCSSRFCENDTFVIDLFKEFFGEEIYKHAVIVFTSKNSKLCKGSISKFVRGSASELRNLIELCGNRIVAIDNASPTDLNDVDIRNLISIVVDLVNDRNLNHLDFDTVNNNSSPSENNSGRNSRSMFARPGSIADDKFVLYEKNATPSKTEQPKTPTQNNHVQFTAEKKSPSNSAIPTIVEPPQLNKCLYYDCSDELVKQQIMVLGDEVSEMNILKEKLTEEVEINSAQTKQKDDSWCELAKSGISIATQFDQFLNDIFRDDAHLLAPAHLKRTLTRKGAVRKSKH